MGGALLAGSLGADHQWGDPLGGRVAGERGRRSAAPRGTLAGDERGQKGLTAKRVRGLSVRPSGLLSKRKAKVWLFVRCSFGQNLLLLGPGFLASKFMVYARCSKFKI